MSKRQRASAEFDRWVHEAVGPVAHRHGLTGRGPTFRRQDGDTWVVLALERRRIDPVEAVARADDAVIPFRIHLGVATSVTRPKWMPARDGPPGMHDIAMHAPTSGLEPSTGAWHVFAAADEAGHARLVDLVAAGLGQGLDALGDTSLRSILETKLRFAGSLENLSPAAAEELLAHADAAGASDVRTRIAEALDRERVRDLTIPSVDDVLRDVQAAFPNARFSGSGVQADGSILPPIRPGRRSPRQRQRLLETLTSERTYPRRQAATALGGWDGDPGVEEALRLALEHEDDWTRFAAAVGLGHLRDSSSETWRRVASLAERAEAGPREVGRAICQLAQLDSPNRVQLARATLVAMAERYPAWSRALRAFGSRLAA